MKKLFLVALLSLGLVVGLTACKTTESTTPEPTTP